MKRQKRRSAGKKTQKTTVAANTEAPTSKRSRRDVLNMLGYGAAGVAVVAGGGWYFASSLQASIAEGDLTKIGNGIPTVVQVHDPECPVCRALQREARDAMGAFDDDQLQFLVANIRETEGRRFAASQGVSHRTLLLFDGAGRRRDVLTGPSTSDFLEEEFQRLIGRPRPSS